MIRKAVTLAKASLAIALFVLTVLGTVVSAQAALIDMSTSSGHVIFDNVANKYWVWDLNAFTGKTYTEQVTTIQNSYATPQYFGLSDWHMATATEMAGLWTNSIRDLAKFNFTYTFPATGETDNHFWFGRYEDVWTGGYPVTSRHKAAAFQIDETPLFGTTPYEWKYALPYFPSGPTGIGAFNDSSTTNSTAGSPGAWVVASAPSAVPEPATMLLFGFGLMGLAGLRRFKK